MQAGPEKSKTSVFAISGSSKIHHTHKLSNTCHVLNFHRKLIFLNANKCPLSESITIKKYQKMLITLTRIPLNVHTLM